MEMDDKLDEFLEIMPQDLNLDFSPQSLLRSEAWMLEIYSTVKDILKENEKSTLDFLARYAGEVYRKNFNGKWKLFLDDPDNVIYELPVVMISGLDPICPITEVTASLDRRRGDYIYDLFQKTAERISDDIN
ncbi:hypothetical protein [Thermoactinomyces mirandus]|uniref:Uncharacterized protein n=1 Tax=Thermoactinomyces mirandus TaxID=2756294 RepID=A0A7W1XTR0_9BACL|nr:hypothetical protein [Thermoactinomyces mirandus]MBA4603119.1 hypothetical protein [Thermoactinomyces mirandus]